MHQITLEQATADIASILQDVANGEEIMIMDHDMPFVKMSPAAKEDAIEEMPWHGRSGFAPGLVVWMAPDFNDTPEEFADYT